MAMPKSVVKLKKGAVTYTSNVDAAQYTIKELTRRALSDIAKVVRSVAKRSVPIVTGTLRRNIATWVKGSKDGLPELQIGVYSTKTAKKKGITPAYHSHLLELGWTAVNGKKIAAKPFLKPAVYDNINTIREIEAKYLSGIDNIKPGHNFDEGEEIKDD